MAHLFCIKTICKGKAPKTYAKIGSLSMAFTGVDDLYKDGRNDSNSSLTCENN